MTRCRISRNRHWIAYALLYSKSAAEATQDSRIIRVTERHVHRGRAVPGRERGREAVPTDHRRRDRAQQAATRNPQWLVVLCGVFELRAATRYRLQYE